MIRITPAEAAAHALLPVEISIRLQGWPLSEWRFPQPNVYVQLSGPPGGPLGISVEQVTLPGISLNGLQSFVEQRLAGQPGRYLRARMTSTPIEVEYVLGESHARAQHLAAFYLPPYPSPHGVLVDCWIGASAPDPAPLREALHGTQPESLPNLVQLHWPPART